MSCLYFIDDLFMSSIFQDYVCSLSSLYLHYVMPIFSLSLQLGYVQSMSSHGVDYAYSISSLYLVYGLSMFMSIPLYLFLRLVFV